MPMDPGAHADADAWAEYAEYANIHIAHEILVPLVKRCVLNSKHATPWKRSKQACFDERFFANIVSPCSSCDCIEVAGDEASFRGLFLGKR